MRWMSGDFGGHKFKLGVYFCNSPKGYIYYIQCFVHDNLDGDNVFWIFQPFDH